MTSHILLEKLFKLLTTHHSNLTENVINILIDKIYEKWFILYENRTTEDSVMEDVFILLLKHYEDEERYEKCFEMMERRKKSTFKEIDIPHIY